jgi:hypothetical protein
MTLGKDLGRDLGRDLGKDLGRDLGRNLGKNYTTKTYNYRFIILFGFFFLNYGVKSRVSRESLPRS